MTPKGKIGESAPHLQINEVVLVYCNIVNNQCKLDSSVLCKFFSNN